MRKTHNEKTKRQEEALRVFDVYDCASEIKCSIYRDRLDMTTSGQQSETAGCCLLDVRCVMTALMNRYACGSVDVVDGGAAAGCADAEHCHRHRLQRRINGAHSLFSAHSSQHSLFTALTLHSTHSSQHPLFSTHSSQHSLFTALTLQLFFSTHSSALTLHSTHSSAIL